MVLGNNILVITYLVITYGSMSLNYLTKLNCSLDKKSQMGIGTLYENINGSYQYFR